MEATPAALSIKKIPANANTRANNQQPKPLVPSSFSSFIVVSPFTVTVSP